MRKKSLKKRAEVEAGLELAGGLRAVKNVDNDEQEALYGIVTMLGGLEMFRCATENAESWGKMTRGLADELVPHLDGVEAILKKYRDRILYEETGSGDGIE